MSLVYFELTINYNNSPKKRTLTIIANNLGTNNRVVSLFTTLCAPFLFLNAVAKSAQFRLHV